MPFTTIKVIDGVFTKEQKAQLIEKVTEAMIEVEGEDMRHLNVTNPFFNNVCLNNGGNRTGRFQVRYAF
ncbi:MAG TPA: tautomerase family protein [Blastocatellia bacterium]|nr:tautomerase family protein [Blastocatellia bacterium]